MVHIGLPNWITLFRISLIPFISFSYLRGKYPLALILLVVGGVSDLIDGALARSLQQRTKLGAVLDPAADKLLMFVCFLTFAYTGDVPVWLLVLVVTRDLYIVTGVIVLKLLRKKFFVRPTTISKINTFVQVSFLFLSLVHSWFLQSDYSWRFTFLTVFSPLFKLFMILTAVLTVLTGVHYTLIWGAIMRGNLNAPPQREGSDESRFIFNVK